MSIYTYVAYATFRQELANRLYDTNKVFWTDAELKLYTLEALRTWNALTGYWRNDFTFSTLQGTIFYDMTSATQMPQSLRLFTALDTDLYTLIAYHLLEPPTGPAPWLWTGSSQFSADDVLNAVARRRDEILSATSCQITRRILAAAAGRTVLPDTVIDVRRVAYLPQARVPLGYGLGIYGQGFYGYGAFGTPGGASVLFPEDIWAEQAFNRNYLQNPPGTPQAYLLSTEPPLSFDVDAPPGGAGNYEVLTVEAGGTLTTTTASALSVPDDWTHLIKWGALADLLSRDSLARDPLRAQYAEQRYRMGLRLLADAPALLQIRVDNVPVFLDSVRDADLFNTGWQGQPQAKPANAYHAGLNMIALSPPDGSYTITATVVQNAPLPVADADPMQMGRDDYDAILDLAVHLALYKSGGQEFQSSLPLLARVLKQASIYNAKLLELAEFYPMLWAQSQREAAINPVVDPTVLADGGA